MTIAGTPVQGAGTFAVVDPASGRVVAHAPDCGRAQLDGAFDAAADACAEWKRDDSLRRDCLRRAARAVFSASADLAPLVTLEQGKPLRDATTEVLGAGVWFKYYAELEVHRQVIQDDEHVIAEVVRKPLGVVAAITPWNFPVLAAAWKIAPALLAGNTVVLKPSPFTPLSTLRLGELLADVFPPGVLNVVSGGNALGAWMTAHPIPRKISFTGSVASGKHVAASAATDLKRVTLELGGNDAAIVLDDVDPAAIADKLFWGAFSNNGQICSAIKRVYVADTCYDAVVEALAEHARSVEVGDGKMDGTELGPVSNRPQLERVNELVGDAIANGATVAAGGRPIDGDGFFFEPTILSGLSDGSRIVDEEQFGPALPVIAYRDVDDAIARANATSFGLSGSVWSGDPDRADDVASRLECGTTWVNTHLALAPHQPFGGVKWSGIGVENGPWGHDAYTDLQVRYRSKA